ncbi:MAG: helix-turn-helix domain-containing protein, partial [Nanoarchaeota archaeon]|nr:helix-turn-helix domain-containing protein [Nanoarchaeota archaeon]
IAVIEKPLIENILYRTEGNQLKAAKILGINRNTLHTKIKKLKSSLEEKTGAVAPNNPNNSFNGTTSAKPVAK